MNDTTSMCLFCSHVRGSAVWLMTVYGTHARAHRESERFVRQRNRAGRRTRSQRRAAVRRNKLAAYFELARAAPVSSVICRADYKRPRGGLPVSVFF